MKEEIECLKVGVGADEVELGEGRNVGWGI